MYILQARTHLDSVRIVPKEHVLLVIEINGVRIITRQSASLQPLLDHGTTPACHHQVDQEHHHNQSCHKRESDKCMMMDFGNRS